MSQENQDITNIGGAIATAASAVMWSLDNLSITDVNNILITVTTLIGIVWMVLRARGQYLDNKIKNKELNK